MSSAYVDTSAAAKLLAREPESSALRDWAAQQSITLVSTILLETELRRFAFRRDVPQLVVSQLLNNLAIYDLAPHTYRSAGLMSIPHLRSLDALHLAGAQMLNVDSIVTYDRRLFDAATQVGLSAISPA